MTKVSCHLCGEEFTSRGLGHHWRQSDCNQPTLSSYQKDLITGLLMGDGHIERRQSGSILQVSMINKPFLEWIDREFGLLSTGVYRKATAEEAAEQVRNTGFRPSAKSENYHDVYSVRTRTLSGLNEFSEWYSSGEKVFPNIDINSVIAKMWYCTDGGLSASEVGRNQAQIRCKNESERMDNLFNMFKDKGFNPTITNNNTRLAFSSDETEELLDWMGEAPPGFQYKWECSSHEEYVEEKEKIFKRLERM